MEDAWAFAGLDTHFWRWEDNFLKSVLSFHLYMGSGLELRLPGLYTKHFTSWAISPVCKPLFKIQHAYSTTHVLLALASILYSPVLPLCFSFLWIAQANLKLTMTSNLPMTLNRFSCIYLPGTGITHGPPHPARSLHLCHMHFGITNLIFILFLYNLFIE